MSQKEVYEFNVPTFGKGVVFDVGHEERAEQFRFFSEALKTARLQTYVQLMVAEAEAFFAERLKESGEVRRGDSQDISPLSDSPLSCALICRLTCARC